jgi:hypothetical protein
MGDREVLLEKAMNHRGGFTVDWSRKGVETLDRGSGSQLILPTVLL